MKEANEAVQAALRRLAATSSTLLRMVEGRDGERRCSKAAEALSHEAVLQLLPTHQIFGVEKLQVRELFLFFWAEWEVMVVQRLDTHQTLCFFRSFRSYPFRPVYRPCQSAGRLRESKWSLGRVALGLGFPWMKRRAARHSLC